MPHRRGAAVFLTDIHAQTLDAVAGELRSAGGDVALRDHHASLNGV